MQNAAQKLLSLSPWIVSAGVVVLLIGLSWDAVLHSLDPDLAAREGIFALTNPGHVLFGGGIAIIVTGALMFFAGKALTAPRPLAFAMPAAAMVALAAASFALAASTGTLGGPGHMHEDGMAHTHDGSEAQHATQGTLHDHGTAINVSAAELEAAARLVAETRAEAGRFENLEVALAEGYYQVAPPRNGLVHYMNTAYNRDGRVLDPERPESLIYLSMADGSWKLVGVMYRMPSPDQPGPRVGGALTAWHAHDNLCTANGRVVATTTDGNCARGTLSRTPEMLHVWLVDNPHGVFADDMEPAALRTVVESQSSN
jgi:hypothetical protein